MSAKSHLIAAVVSGGIAGIATGLALYCTWYRATARIMGESVNFEAIERAGFYAPYCRSFAGFAFAMVLVFLLLYRSSHRKVGGVT
jgi:hypothetical protein